MSSGRAETGHRGATSDCLLCAEGLSMFYADGRVQALDDLSFHIARGDYVAVMGPSGSGKSTLLNMLGALDRPTSGEVYFEGKPLAEFYPWDRFRCEQVGFVFQSFHLLPALTALENVQIPMLETRRSAAERASAAESLLELVGLASRRHHLPHALSVGERQRVAVARALANNPPLLLADEPTGNLDSAAAEAVLDLFARLHTERRLTLVVITHDPALSRRAQRVLRLKDGRLIADEPAGAIGPASSR